jgi:CRP-like cAMP-binding protein
MLHPDELRRASVWGAALDDTTLARVAEEVQVRQVGAGEHFISRGDRIDAWHGVVGGLIKLSTISNEGKSTSLHGVPTGGWFGEGSLLKRVPRQYDAVALRASKIALMPIATFDWLIETNLAFNRFLIAQLNERLGLFIATVEHDRLLSPDGRIAQAIATLFNPVLFPPTAALIQISQEELGNLAGTSRQRVNQALQVLERAGLLRVEYGSIQVTNLAGLRAFTG